MWESVFIRHIDRIKAVAELLEKCEILLWSYFEAVEETSLETILICFFFVFLPIIISCLNPFEWVNKITIKSVGGGLAVVLEVTVTLAESGNTT